MAPVKVAVIGAGNRGFVYAAYALDHADRMQVVAVAEPRAFRRAEFAARFGVAADRSVDDWRALLALHDAGGGRIADAVLICVQDRLHAEVAVAFAARKYHILLEKPMAVTLEDCLAIHAAVEANGVMLAVGHVLRYTSLNRAIRRAIDDGRVGRVVAIQHLEPIGFFHYAHSYVRGNWRREAEATFALMAKSCHDLDLFAYWLRAPAKRISSVGSLDHFRRDQKPAAAGAAARCVDCPIERDCPYSAVKIYLEPTQAGKRGWPIDVITDVVDVPHVKEALATGPYGRCVYECDNDVVDHQAVTIEFATGQVVSFMMLAFTEFWQSRSTRIFGTHGELVTDGTTLTLHDFNTRVPEKLPLEYLDASGALVGHDGGDFGLIDAFVRAVATNDPTPLLSGARESLASHLMVFAAEHARRTSTVVDFDAYCAMHNVPADLAAIK